MKLRFLPRARNDIAAIHDYIASPNPRAATAVVRSIRATGRLLARHPGLARATNMPGICVLPVRRYPYLVYHFVSVRHGARSAPKAEEL